MLSAHPQKWEFYKTMLTGDDRNTFFGASVLFQDTLGAHFESGGSELCIGI
jgi:hypothetical protein